MSQNIVFSFPYSVFICLIFYIFSVFPELGLSEGVFFWVESLGCLQQRQVWCKRLYVVPTSIFQSIQMGDIKSPRDKG